MNAAFAVAGAWVAVALAAQGEEPQPAATKPPSLVIIVADDLGFGDLACFGGGTKTPNLDALAAEGVRFTDYYVPQAICSASRAALLTGCYPNRIGIQGALTPRDTIGLADEEVTLAELARARGHATAAFGKWHLGCQSRFLPTRHGFDAFRGIPYSHDMTPRNPELSDVPQLPLYEGEDVVAIDPDPREFTKDLTERAIDFMRAHREAPFLVYLAYPMPHVPLAVSPAAEGATGRGIYPDVVREMDVAIGRLLRAIEKLELDEKTLVLFTSDNGPWLSYGEHAGSAGGLREGKGTSFEGGVRVPCIARWKGVIPAGRVCGEPLMSIDVFPTISRLLAAEAPKRPIDGRNAWSLFTGSADAKSPQGSESAYFFWNPSNELEAMRSGKWKLHFPHRYRTLSDRAGGRGGRAAPYEQASIGLALFDLEVDPGETKDVAAEQPEVVARLQALADAARKDLGDAATGVKASGARAPGRMSKDGR